MDRTKRRQQAEQPEPIGRSYTHSPAYNQAYGQESSRQYLQPREVKCTFKINKFDGTPSKLQNFLGECDFKFAKSPILYSQPIEQVGTAYEALEGTAQEWAGPIIRYAHPSISPHNWEAFRQGLVENFSDPAYISKCTNQLRALKQTLSVQEYSVKF
jgi:hypothetical protein